ncbi:hypothetical protein CCACVL1_16599 [Corchorus capsularis]|uniref:Glabrous enhancer-binding protein-like DBD domain-containing protein n=1 Tax=Corchorus capsularis TaxID=210143 RepID=A0A1R3HW33_COCAP|nr:hypothetical protein CCACVL1_16599 [Corchorus capsularis]
MARKRPDPIEEPPAASSSDEEEEEEEKKREDSSEDEEEGSSSEEGSSEEEEDDVPATQPPKKPETPAPATAAADDSDDESGSESESESDSDSPTPIVKPIATKPMEDASNAKKPRSKTLASPVKASAAKRPSESEGLKDNKRAKKKASEEGNTSTLAVEVKKEDAKKQLFQRLFTEEDEIAVLKGMLDYADKKGADPCVDMNAFHDFVKKYIHTDVTKAQLMDKIRRLKKKYENNAGKGKKGEDRTFTKPHEQKSFELSKKIWGKDGISGKVESSAAKSNGKATLKELALSDKKTSDKKKVDVAKPMEVDKEGSKSGVCLFDKRYGVASLEGEVLKHGLEMIGGEKRAALEEKWKKIHIAELELFLQRSELITEQAKLLLEHYKSEDK